MCPVHRVIRFRLLAIFHGIFMAKTDTTTGCQRITHSIEENDDHYAYGHF